ncbi:MAG: diacylglycerol kinase family protein [Thermodesulfovibrionales bacterium]
MKSLIVLISNPSAKGTTDNKIRAACHILEAGGYEVEHISTGQRGDAEVFAREAVKKSPSMIIAAGGDGTINEVINGIAGSEIPLAFVPLGTVNVLAKELAVPENVEGAIKKALHGTPRIVSLGKIVIAHPSTAGRYFILMAGIGYDGETVFGINETLKKYWGMGAYFYSGIKTLLRFNPAELIFDIDGQRFSGYSAIIGNAAKYGGNFMVAPHARLTDPALYICIFKKRKRTDIIRYVSGIVTGRHLNYKDVEYLRAEQIEIQGNAHIQIDGDYMGMTPARVEVKKNALRLIY